MAVRRKRPVRRAAKRKRASRKGGSAKLERAAKAKPRPATKPRTTKRKATRARPLRDEARTRVALAGEPATRTGTQQPGAPQVAALIAGVPVAVGVVTHYYRRARAALVALSGQLAVGDTLHVRGANTDFIQRATSLWLDGVAIPRAEAPASVGVELGERAREGDAVYRVDLPR